jgi:hypothetical protein
MDHDPISYEAMFESAGIDGESLSVVLVRDGTRAKVLDLLGAEAETNGQHDPVEDDDYSAYALAEVQGGVIAFEHTGYADPSPRVLAALSELGGAAAVTRSNIQAHERFGCATDGVLVFDADEFMYVEEDEKDALPRELLPMFESVWVDLGDDGDDGDHEDAGGFVGYAMAAKHTGVVVTSDDLRRAVQQGYHRVPTLTYLE